ncbi:acetyl-CoA C-acetyltransferase [Ilumatobacter fluminis]|uniref:Probable acetyl-CoA acetyltransferase n=1 Tax=Ilumatobacter fluminis TaxID=467091 RepID=A0A4R7I4S7_9ACTN|nr:acetyl-CoA C-acetyltransferase [Ilumatobacter fluminis]TDT18692.1 acetyl-CoA C-acetyltransferase [Ilumatobacter fluminis]
MSGSVIVAGARTPIGKMSGALTSLSAAELGGHAISAALERAGVSPDQVDHVIMGQVLMAGQGQVPARQAAVNAGIPMRVPSVNINKVCLSGLNSIYLAHQMIASGDADIVVAGGMESMTNAPYLARGARGGFRYGNVELEDAIIRDGLWCAFDACLMGTATDGYSAGITRQQMDEVAAASHERAATATKDGVLADEIAPISIPQRKGDPVLVEHDEGVRPGTTADSLGKLRPAFVDDGTITAGNASQISDGGSAVVMMSQRAAAECGVDPLGEVVSYGMVAGPDNPSLNLQPANAIRAALAKTDLSIGDISVFELNEAFAAVGIASADDLGISLDVVNPNGGAIALGHPIGMSGNRLALTLLHELRRRGGGVGAAALCGGGGQGDALIVRANG